MAKITKFIEGVIALIKISIKLMKSATKLMKSATKTMKAARNLIYKIILFVIALIALEDWISSLLHHTADLISYFI